jgi:outer membrane protein OmpA-like peptidoglycan-associated protein
MIRSGKGLVLGIGIPIALALATSGCATKKYVSQQVAPVNQRVSTLEKTTNDKISAVWHKEESDISQVNERISTTDQRVAQMATAVQEAQGTASRAMQETEANSTKIAENTTAITTLGTGVANALNYQLVEKGDVTFAFNKATLTPAAKLALDQIALKAAQMPRVVVELAGFTDKVGGVNYNLALSRRRAEAVQRYLVMQKVPLRSIHIVGLGEEAPPEGLTADLSAVDQNPSKADLRRLARRVHIRVYGAGDITQGTASRSEQQ